MLKLQRRWNWVRFMHVYILVYCMYIYMYYIYPYYVLHIDVHVHIDFSLYLHWFTGHLGIIYIVYVCTYIYISMKELVAAKAGAKRSKLFGCHPIWHLGPASFQVQVSPDRGLASREMMVWLEMHFFHHHWEAMEKLHDFFFADVFFHWIRFTCKANS